MDTAVCFSGEMVGCRCWRWIEWGIVRSRNHSTINLSGNKPFRLERI
jgi:hypothetical protein